MDEAAAAGGAHVGSGDESVGHSGGSGRVHAAECTPYSREMRDDHTAHESHAGETAWGAHAGPGAAPGDAAAYAAEAAKANILFGETTVGGVRMRNRLVRAATYEALATDDGLVTPELTALYEQLAKGGAGAVITGYAFVSPEGQANPNMLSICSDATVPGLRSLATAARAHDCAAVAQIVHGGSATTLDPSAVRILGPSAVENPKSGVAPVAATEADITRIIDAFAAAAVRARDAGFDGVELHAAHGYLLSQFLNPLLNKRTDRYGGSIENRARIVVEVLDAVRDAVGTLYPVWVKLNSSDGIKGGLTEENSLVVARMLADHGAAAIEVSGPWRMHRPADFAGTPFFADYARRLASMLVEDAAFRGDKTAPSVILTGGVRRLDVAAHLASADGIAAFGLCRPLISEPDLPNRWRTDPGIRPRCTSCNGCGKTPGHRCVMDEGTRS